MSSDFKQSHLTSAAKPHLELDSSFQGIVLIALGIGVFSIQDVFIRSLGNTYPGFEIMFIRGLVAIVPIFLFVMFSGGLQTLKVRHPFLNILRGVLALVSYTCYYMALQALPLAVSTAIFFVSPLIVTLLSVIFLRERVGIRRLVAVLAGFAGVMLIVRPTGGDFSAAMILPILAAVTYSISIIITRHIGKAQTGSSLAFYAMSTFIVASGLAGLFLGVEIDATSLHPSIAFLVREWVMPTPQDALPGRDEPMPVPDRHFVLDAPLRPPYPDGLEIADFGLGCFWGAERKFWQVDGVYTTAVGYQAGLTPHPTYREVCSGRTGHNETVRVVFDPARVSYDELLRVFWEAHDPTQGMRQGNDVGTQYRSGIYWTSEAQKDAAEASKAMFAPRLGEAGFGAVTTEIVAAPTFYFAEEYHQQYLAKNPNGYCGLGGTGIGCPMPRLVDSAADAAADTAAE